VVSRRALWPSAVLARERLADDAEATSAPGRPDGNGRAPSRHVAAGAEMPEAATAAHIRPQGAPGGAVNAALARIADLHDQLGRAHRELSVILQNELAVPRERALMSGVQKPLLTVPDVAHILVLSDKTVRRLRQRGELPRGIEIAGEIRWRAEEIEQLLASGGAP